MLDDIHLSVSYKDQIEGSVQDYANSLFDCSFENLMAKYTFCEIIRIHVFAKSAFIHNLKIVKVPNERNVLCKTSLTSMRVVRF